MRGSASTARAIAMRWRCPPLKREPVLTDDGVVPVRQRIDEVGRTGEAGRALDHFHRGLGVGERDVLAHGVGEEERVFEHDPDRAAQIVDLRASARRHHRAGSDRRRRRRSAGRDGPPCSFRNRWRRRWRRPRRPRMSRSSPSSTERPVPYPNRTPSKRSAPGPGASGDRVLGDRQSPDRSRGSRGPDPRRPTPVTPGRRASPSSAWAR